MCDVQGVVPERELIVFGRAKDTVATDAHLPLQTRKPARRDVLCKELEEHVSRLARSAPQIGVRAVHQARKGQTRRLAGEAIVVLQTSRRELVQPLSFVLRVANGARQTPCLTVSD